MIASILAAVVTALVMFVPGVLLSFALLNGVSLNRLEKILFGVVLGLIVVPLMALAENMAGVPFNAVVVLANSIIASAAALFFLHQQGALKAPLLPSLDSAPLQFARRNWVALALVALMLLAFYVRFATAWAVNFFEFDPYFYMRLTEKLVQNGFIETWSQDSYFPAEAFLHHAPITSYLTGSWYAVYSAFLGAAYSKELLIGISQLYPPLVAALMCFLGFVLVREEYGKHAGIVVAGLIALTPQLIKKLSAGVAEQQPWGLFMSLLIFTVYLLAVNRKSYRLAALAGTGIIASYLGSQQYIWPIMILAAYVWLQTIMDYFADRLDEKQIKINALMAAAALIGNIWLAVYQEFVLTQGVLFVTQILLLGVIFSAVLYLARTRVHLDSKTKRLQAFSALAVIGLVGAFVVTPFGFTALNAVSNQMRLAYAGNALAKTIQEEGATSSSLFASSYGVLYPPTILLLAAVLSAAVAVLNLYNKRRTRAIAWAVFSAAVIFLNNLFDSVLTWFADWLGNAGVSELVAFVAQNDVFVYLFIGVASTVTTYYYAEKKNRSALLFILVFFPIAYIGLNKLKYMVHLALALCLAAGYLFGESVNLSAKINSLLKLASNHAAARASTLALFALGAALVTAQFTGVTINNYATPSVQQAMLELNYTRIPADWTQAYEWMRSETPEDSRIISWWDYGHWTTFFGERDTVIDPNNAHSDFDQGVARAFVDGDINDLYELMDYHEATHVLVDVDLVGKWGALVFLSGSCTSELSSVCPEQAEIDWTDGPGKSRYEAEHYYEYLTYAGNCPVSTPVQIPAYQSSFGPVYCLTQDGLLLVGRQGLEENYTRAIYAAMPGQPIIDEDAAYLVQVGNNQFINVNPDLSMLGLENNVLNSAFTRFFFFEEVPGFKLAYASPNGMVKIFEYARGG